MVDRSNANSILQLQLLRRGAFSGQYEYQEVTFPNANEDVRIRHNLKAVPFTDIYYLPIQKDKAGDIYTGTLSLWTPDTISLKSTVSNLTITLLLFTRRD